MTTKKTGDFVALEVSSKRDDWTKYAYLPEEELNKGFRSDKLITSFTPELSDHFEKAKSNKFRGRSLELKISKFIFGVEVNYKGFSSEVPCLWANDNLIIRQGTMIDRKQIEKMLPEANEATKSWVEMDYMKWILRTGMCLVVTDYNNSLKGFQTLYPEGEAIKLEDILYIAPECRKQGAYSVIHEVVAFVAEKAGFSSLYAQCGVWNDVKHIFEHVGFVRREEIKMEKEPLIMFDKKISSDDNSTFF